MSTACVELDAFGRPIRSSCFAVRRERVEPASLLPSSSPSPHPSSTSSTLSPAAEARPRASGHWHALGLSAPMRRRPPPHLSQTRGPAAHELLEQWRNSSSSTPRDQRLTSTRSAAASARMRRSFALEKRAAAGAALAPTSPAVRSPVHVPVVEVAHFAPNLSEPCIHRYQRQSDYYSESDTESNVTPGRSHQPAECCTHQLNSRESM